jgi:hypothetical protein
MSANVNGLLVDTWWYALTTRLKDEDFLRLAALRVAQGFNAVQLVCGIPPETTPENPNAASPVGPAWTRSGEFNEDYLQFARQRLLRLNELGLTVIVYGAWGPQVNWLGVERMIAWWQEVIGITRDQDVIYCLTGESNLQPGIRDLALFNNQAELMQSIDQLMDANHFTRKVKRFLFRTPAMMLNRRHAWSVVLREVAKMTPTPILLHVSPGLTAFDCVEDPDLLAANSVQTGHSEQSRPWLHKWPLEHYARVNTPGKGFLNMEPWYEGIRDRFRGPDQLYAYWVSMLCGAVSHCYGAHGVWNAGDGVFLGHWGNQTLEQAMALDTPRLMGLSHQLFRPFIGLPATVVIDEKGNGLVSVTRSLKDADITFIPEVNGARMALEGEIWLPMEGRFTEQLPSSGQVVLIARR